MRPPVVIGLAGLAGCGKSTAAQHLVEHHGFTRIRFAGPLKAMMAALGLSHEQIDGSLKETPCEMLGGKTPRHAMQTLGTEWGRDLICANLWVRAWSAAVDRAVADGAIGIVADDCRFLNEASAIWARGGKVLRIERADAASASGANHASEKQPLGIDRVIGNDGSIEDLHRAVDEALADRVGRLAA